MRDALKNKRFHSSSFNRKKGWGFYKNRRRRGMGESGMINRFFRDPTFVQIEGIKKKNVTSRCVFENVIARTKSFASMFGILAKFDRA